MTRLLWPALEVAVEIAVQVEPPGDAPARLNAPAPLALRGRLEPLSSWMVEQDWWERPVRRRYWKVLLEGRVLLELFHDLGTGAWFLERVYD